MVPRWRSKAVCFPYLIPERNGGKGAKHPCSPRRPGVVGASWYPQAYGPMS